jgi:YegS/Rv2252/BmrU family lipid kinase
VSSPGQARALACQAVRDRFDIVVAAGGDGTVNEVVNGLAGSSVALGIIPAGTANDLAWQYGLPRNAEKACGVILGRHLHRADLIRANDRFFISTGGLGLPAEAAQIANRLKSRRGLIRLLARLLSSKIYIFAAVWAVLFRPRCQNFIKIQSPGECRLFDIFSLTVSNQPCVGRNFRVCPGAANDDGELDVCLIENSRSRLEKLSILWKVMAGRHTDLPSVRLWRAAQLAVEAESPQSFLGDGEVGPESRSFQFRVMPRAISVIIPESWLPKEGDLDAQAA